MSHILIVGAGSAGCVLAARLSEDPRRSVVLLEAGPDYPTVADMPRDIRNAFSPALSHDWGYSGVPRGPIPAIPLPRGRLVGGCSATNAAFALRGTPGDYDEWAARGSSGWSFADVLPTFCALEHDADFGGPHHGADGPVPVRRYPPDALVAEQRAFLDACAVAGHASVDDHNAPGAVGAGRAPMNIVDGVRWSTALSHLLPARDRPNLTVRSMALVDRVVFDGRRATGVRLTSGVVMAAGHVILAAGAYNSPAILLRSGVGDPTHLRALGIEVRAVLPGVGQHLLDHPRVRVRFAAAPHDHDVPGCQAVLTLRSATCGAGHDLHVFPWSTTADGTFTLSCGLMKPESTGSVRLRSADPADAPIIDCGFFSDPRDMPRMIDAVRAARALAAASPLAAIAAREVYPGPDVGDSAVELDRAIRAELRTYFHPVGTCRMGPETDRDAVVDADGRVHGIDGLSVIDASIMPTIPAANTNLPTIMVAERCAARFTPT